MKTFNKIHGVEWMFTHPISGEIKSFAVSGYASDEKAAAIKFESRHPHWIKEILRF